MCESCRNTYLSLSFCLLSIFFKDNYGRLVILGVKSNRLWRDEEIREDKWKLSDGVREEEMRGKIARGRGIDHERN